MEEIFHISAKIKSIFISIILRSLISDYFVINFDGPHFDWTNMQNDTHLTITQLQEICAQYEVFLSIDFTPSTIKTILATVQPLGISVKASRIKFV